MAATDTMIETAAGVMVGRQPILDRCRRTVAYELLFRSAEPGPPADGDAATSAVIANVFLNLWRDQVLGSKLGFINFTEHLLISGQAHLLPCNQAVVEILEDVVPGPAVVQACRELRKAQYTIALDDVVSEKTVEPLLPYTRIAKLDFQALLPIERARLAAYFHARGIQVLAEKVETPAEYEEARTLGCDFYQGYFFAHPEVLHGRQVPSYQMNCLRLICEAQARELDFARINRIIAADVGLAHKLLLCVNSAAFGTRSQIHSIKQALSQLGETRIRRWITIAALPLLASGKPAELVTASLVRARFCELAAGRIGRGLHAATCFLIGLLSLLDAIIERPLDQILNQMPLDSLVVAAILHPGTESRESLLLAASTALERCHWEHAAALAGRFGLPPASFSAWHLDAMKWAADLSR